MPDIERIEEAAQVGREVATVAALALIQTDGDPHAAVEILASMSAMVPAEGDELDAAGIAAQAIRDANEMRAVPR